MGRPVAEMKFTVSKFKTMQYGRKNSAIEAYAW